jgi:hypothetical protein
MIERTIKPFIVIYEDEGRLDNQLQIDADWLNANYNDLPALERSFDKPGIFVVIDGEQKRVERDNLHHFFEGQHLARLLANVDHMKRLNEIIICFVSSGATTVYWISFLM